MKHSTTVRIDKDLLRHTVFVLIDEAKEQLATTGCGGGRLLDVARRLLAAEKADAKAAGAEAVEAA